MFFLAFFAETRMLLFRYGNVYRGGIRVYPLRGGRHVGVGPLGAGMGRIIFGMGSSGRRVLHVSPISYPCRRQGVQGGHLKLKQDVMTN